MSIGYGCLAVSTVIRKHSDFNFVSRKTWRYPNILHPTFFYVVGGQQPKSLLAVRGGRREHHTLALSSFRRMNETRRPAWRPFRLPDRSKERRDGRDRPFQGDGEGLRSLLERGARFSCRG